MTWRTDILIEGEAEGTVLRFEAPISFWGGVNPETAVVSLAGHPQFGEVIADRILVIPQLVGSSSSSAVMLELLYRNIAPRALILGDRDAILPVGVVVAGQMGWSTIPVLILANPVLQSGDRVRVDREGTIRMLSDMPPTG